MRNFTTTMVSKRNRFSMKFFGILVVFLGLSGNGWGQTNPTAQSLPYSQSFGTTTFSTIPSGMASWSGLSGAGLTSQTTAEASAPSANATLTTATVSQTTGGTYGYATSSNGRVYIQTSSNTSSGANQIALAINTTNKQSIVVSYDVEIISAQPRTVGIVMQYRVGTSGSWTTVTGTGNPYSQAAGTTGVKTSPSLTLPVGANNQSVVQIRWATWRGTEGGNSSGVAIDNISVTGTDIPAASSSSNIIGAANETSNIAYASYQASSITATTEALKVYSFTIQDGGGAADGDLFPTLLSSITFTKGSGNSVTNWANTIRKAALFDGPIKVAEVDVAGETIAFTGLSGVNVAADDGGSKTLDLFLTFESSVTDNQQLQFQIASANVSAAVSGSSTFSAFTAVSSSTTGDANRIEVTASDIIFDQNTSTVSLGAVISPSPTLRAIDANLNYDLDYAGAYSVAVSTGSATLDATATTSGNFSTGVVTLSNLKFDGAGTANNITVTSGSFTDISSAFDVTNPQPEINIKQAATSIASGGSYGFGNQLSGSSSSVITFTVENLGTAELSLSGAPKVAISGTNASEFTIDQTTTSATVSASATTTFTITFSPSSQGSKTAAISIANNDGTGSENPYVINLTGIGTVSAASDISNTSGYIYTSNIAYASYQTATTLTTGNSVGATGITIRDGAATTDADNLGTTLTAISFTTGGSTAIRTAALFDGSTNVSEVAVNGGTTISFTGLSLSAADNGTKDLELRVTYMATVTDNQQITFTVSAATAPTTGSGFAAANAGGFASSATSDINRIEVTATQLAFVQQPTNSVIGGNTTPAVTVKAIDANSITDLDFTANVDITSTGTLSSSPQTSAAVAGIATFSSVSHSATGSGLMLTAASSGLTSVESGTFNVTVQAAGVLLVDEDFNYTASQNITTVSSNWGIISSSTTKVATTASGLSFVNYPSTSDGAIVFVNSSSSEDVGMDFTSQTSGSIYYSALINLSAVNTGYFTGFTANKTSANYEIRIYSKVTSGNLNFGLARGSATATYGTTNFTLNTTYLIVLKLTMNSGANNDRIDLFVLPTNSNSEPTTPEVSVLNITDVSTIGAIFVRQDNSSAAGTIDGVRVATNWGSLVGNASYDSNANISAGNYNSINVMNGSTLTQTGNVVASGLTIGSGSAVTINAGKQLTISGTLTNSAGNSGFVLKSDATGTATLINSTAGVNATVEQYLPQGRNWYVGLPVSSGSTSTLTAAGLGTSVSYWNEAGSAWVNSYSGSLTPGRGYIAASSSGTGTNNASFTGILNSGNVTIRLTKKGTSKIGFNLVANPYPSYIDAVALVGGATTNMEQTVWYRTKVSTAYHFPTVNTASGVATDASGAANPVTRLIPPMQSFWVRTNTDDYDLVFTNAMRYHANATVGGNPVTTTPMKVKQTSESMLVRINVSNGINQDQMVIYTDDNANNAYDIYDSRKMMNENANIPDLYSVVGPEKLVINGLKTIVPDTEIELGFVPGKSGSFSINATELKNISSDVYVAIKDKLQNIEFNLTSGQTYEFSSDAVNDTNRFSIIFRSAGTTTGLTGSKLNTSTSVFVNANGELVVKTSAPLSANATVSIYNAIGQQIGLQTLTSSMSIANVARTAGVYWVKLNSDGEVVTRKVVVK